MASAPPAHPAPTLYGGHAPLSLHPEGHHPRRSCTTIPCTENRPCARRGHQIPRVLAVEAKHYSLGFFIVRNARKATTKCLRSRLTRSCDVDTVAFVVPRDHHWQAVVFSMGIEVQ